MNLMIKIFGVVLIVSGSVMIGWIPSNSQRKRLERLIYIRDGFASFQTELKHQRCSLETYFSENHNFLEDDANQWLSNEERGLIVSTMEKMKSDSYNDALIRCGSVIDQLTAMIDELKKAEDKNGKARPLVTGALGLLLAVLLF